MTPPFRLAFAGHPEHIKASPKQPVYSADLEKIEMDFKFCFCLIDSGIMLPRRGK